MELDAGDRAVWWTTLRSLPLRMAGLASLAVGAILTVATVVWLGLVIAVIGTSVLVLSAVHVRIDQGGLRVRYGVLPWPTTRIDTGRISSARIIDVRPTEWGGLGYRGSLRLGRRAAVVLRAGPGIRLDLTDGRTFVVTVDDPEAGVRLLNAELRRHRTPEGNANASVERTA